MKERLDVVIIGLGPAGATLARLLPDSLNIATIDRKTDRGPGFRKLCGGLLAPDAQKLLARFALTLPKSVLVDPQIFSVRTIDLDSDCTRHYQRFYLNIDRHAFDQWLISLIPPHVTRYEEAVALAIEREEGGYAVRFRQGETVSTLHTRLVVGADGARSLVRRTAYPDWQPRAYLAVQKWFADANPQPFYSCIFDSRETDCYSWALSKEGSFLFGGAYPLNAGHAALERQMTSLTAHGFRFGTPQRTEACMVLRPRGLRDLRTGEHGLLLIGEAGGFISPSSLEGISSAMESARLLAEALAQNPQDPAPLYHRLTRSLRLKLALKTLKCPFLYQPFLRKYVMRSGLKAIRLHRAL